MKTCKSCKHWKQDTEDGRVQDMIHPRDPETYEPVDVNLLPFEVRYCKSPKLLQYERPKTSDDAATVDGSEYFSALVTGPDFGCVNHEFR